MRGSEEKLPNLILKFRLVEAVQVVGNSAWTRNRHTEGPPIRKWREKQNGDLEGDRPVDAHQC